MVGPIPPQRDRLCPVSPPFMILAYRGDRPHYLEPIGQTIQYIGVAADHTV